MTIRCVPAVPPLGRICSHIGSNDSSRVRQTGLLIPSRNKTDEDHSHEGKPPRAPQLGIGFEVA